MEGNPGLWELPSRSIRGGIIPNRNNLVRNSLYGNGSVLPQISGRASLAPPLPPRPQNFGNTYTPPSPYYNNFGPGGYSTYGGTNYGYGYRPGFNSYGYGFGHNGYYNANNPESRFIQIAEESSRPAFQAIQSVLQSFSSVAMMFDSTFNALYSSYMSVISVADNFGKLRSTFGQVFSLLAIFRALYWMYRRILYYLGISETYPETEDLWVNAFKNKNGLTAENTQKSWSTMLLLSIIMAGPYLLFKLMSHIYPNPTKETWNPVQHPGTTAVAVYDFQSSNEQELNFSCSQKLMIAPEKFQPSNCPGWVLACNANQKIGLVPKNYIGMMVRSEKTGKQYVEYNGQNYEINPYSDPGSRKNFEDTGKIFAEVFTGDQKKPTGNAEK